MNRIAIIFVLAGITTFALFAFMAFLVSSDQVGIEEPDPPIIIDFVKIPDETKINKIVRHHFEPPTPPPVLPRNQVSPETTELTTGFDYVPTSLDISNGVSNIVTINGQPNTDARPIVRVNPKYPIGAARDAIEGWVTLAFDISAIGEVINVKIIDSQPKRIFDKAAKKALKKWKYRAKLVDGEHVEQYNFTVQLDFNMEQHI